MSNNNDLKNTRFCAKSTGEECDIPSLKNKTTQLSDVVCVNGIYYKNKMSNNKQSSIDFLVNLLIEKGYAGVLSEDEIKQSKAMHEYEIENAYDEGWHNNNDDRYNPITYYNSTFGGNNDK